MRILRCLSVLMISLLLPGLVSGEEEEDFSTPHKRAFACFNNQEMTFADDPVDCEAVCNVCHTNEKQMAGDATASFILVYTLVFEEAVANLTAADLTVAGGELVAGSLTMADDATWTFKVKPAGSVTDVGVTLNNAKSAVITKKLLTERVIEGQSQNPELLWTDIVYPGLYPKITTNNDEQNWGALPALHQSCKECHSTQSEAIHNHPMFINMAIDFGDGSTEELGLLLCATCHDPHSNKVTLLRLENTGSQLCQYCHGK